MSFVGLTSAYVRIMGVQSKQVETLTFTKSSSAGFVTFDKNSLTFIRVRESFIILDAYTGDSVNNTDYLQVYINGQTKGDRITGGVFKTAPTGAPRLTLGPFPAGDLQLYWYSA